LENEYWKFFCVVACAGVLTASDPPATASDGDSAAFKMSTMVKSLRHRFGSMRGSYLNPGERADAPHLTLFLKPNSDRDVLSGELESWARREAVIAAIETRRLR